VEKVFNKVASSDTEIEVKAVRKGLDKVFPVSSSYFDLLNKKEIIERVIEAEEEGYDAAIVGCFLDPGVREAREIVNIPVIGVGEPTLCFAQLLGRKFAIVTVNDPKILKEFEIELKVYGMEGRIISNGIRPISTPTLEVFTKGMEKPELVASDILEKAKECVEDGAEVVIVGCNGLGPLCTVSNVVEVEDTHVPILDCVAVAIKMAEVVVDLGNKLKMPPLSRAGFYIMPREKDMKRVRSIFVK
jgi:allantoin racemase